MVLLCIMRRLPILGFVVLALAVTGLPAKAHGGAFRAPGAPPSGPGLGPSPVPAAITPGETWQTYWDLNRMGLIPGRDEAARRGVVTPRTDDEGDPETAWAQRRAKAAREDVIPFLLRMVDPKQKVRDEVRAAALIALGKVSSDPVVHTFFLHYLHDPKSKTLVRESAALAIGLLRRSVAALQQTPADLDMLREALIQVVTDADDELRVRSFAALGLALLGDQPFATSPTKDGRMVVRALWQHFGPKPKNVDLPVCMLTALGMQPAAGMPDAVREGLKEIVVGKPVRGRRWTPFERSHALTALARIGGPGVEALLTRVTERPGEDAALRRAACIALGRLARSMDTETRARFAVAIEKSLKRRRDPATSGLALVALARLLSADLGAGKVTVLQETNVTGVLLRSAEKATSVERGYAILALAFAAQGARASGHAMPFYARARSLITTGLESGRGDDSMRATYAVGCGLLELEDQIDALVAFVRDTGCMPVLRGHAAVALGQIGRRRDVVVPALLELLGEKRGVLLRVRTAMALALMGGADVRTQLEEELHDADSEYHRAHVVIALGRLGDLRTIPALLELGRNPKANEMSQALAIVALGMITDPEPRPSVLKLSEDANWPAGTQVLYSAFSIF